MGMEYVIALPDSVPDLWPSLAALLSRHVYPVQLRMIDGQLAFPDETPPPDWRELRLGTEHGMITVRRESNHVRVVTWGNAGPDMQQAWNAVAWAVAAATGGTIETATGAVTAAEFRQTASLPPAMS